VFFHAYAAAPVALWVVWANRYTMALVIFSLLLSLILEHYGYTPVVGWRTVRSFLAGRRVNRVPRIGNRRLWKP
jgi:hypothetical protein